MIAHPVLHRTGAVMVLSSYCKKTPEPSPLHSITLSTYAFHAGSVAIKRAQDLRETSADSPQCSPTKSLLPTFAGCSKISENTQFVVNVIIVIIVFVINLSIQRESQTWSDTLRSFVLPCQNMWSRAWACSQGISSSYDSTWHELPHAIRTDHGCNLRTFFNVDETNEINLVRNFLA